VCTITGLTELGTAVANKNVFRYRSYIYDADLGWYYLQSRYYDPQIGRFINGYDAAYLGANETALSYNLFVYCESDPVNYSDESGMAPTRVGVLYMNISHSELLNRFKATVDAYFGNNVEYVRYRTIGNFNLFKRGWEAVKNCDVVFVDLHGAPEGLYDDKERIVLTNGNARSLPNINAKAVFLNCCNAGHSDYRNSSIAHFLKFKICGSLLGSDGTVYFGFNSNLNTHVFSSRADERWRRWCMWSSYHRLRRKNNGWMLYQKGKYPRFLSSDIQYNITFPKFMNYLRKNHLY